jgi:protein subunit release factor B
MQKTSNKVTLRHTLSGLVIRCHKTRNLENNRSAARKILSERLDKLVNGPLSKSSQKGEKLRKKKGKPKITSLASSSKSLEGG